MDSDRFDTLTRSLSTVGSRRRALAAVLGGSLGLLGLDSIAAKNKKKKACPPCKKRKKGKCKGTLPDGAGCTGGTCQSGSCIAAASPPPGPTCSDGIKNGSETDLDCGGGCPRCANFKTCASRNDCASAYCSGGSCLACDRFNPECGDGCLCRTSLPSGANVCTKAAMSGDFVSSCAQCPTGTICDDPGAAVFRCSEPCSAP